MSKNIEFNAGIAIILAIAAVLSYMQGHLFEMFVFSICSSMNIILEAAYQNNIIYPPT